MLEATFKKVLPQIKEEVIREAMRSFNVANGRDVVTRQDFETIFTEQQHPYIPNSSRVNFKGGSQSQSNLQSSVKSQEADEDAMKWIRKLDNAMLREKISPGVAFKLADTNMNGIVTSDELRESFKKLIPDDSLSLIDLKKVMMAFDLNKNGCIEESEFISMIEQARNFNVTYLESPAKSASGAALSNDRRGALPLKNQDLA